MSNSKVLLTQIDAAIAFVFTPPSDPEKQRMQLMRLGSTAHSLYERLAANGCPVRLNLVGLELAATSPDDPTFFENLGVCLSLIRHVCECPICREEAGRPAVDTNARQ